MATNTTKSETIGPDQKSVSTSDAQAKDLKADVDERQRSHDDLTAAIKAAFATPESNPRTRFHEQFQKEADEYDKDFHKKYRDDLNTILIFAGLFSVVATAFIIDVQSQIRPDYNRMSFTVLTMLLNATTSGASNELQLPTWSGPNPSIVQVQSILFSSLASALLAAFLASLAKQWLNFYVEGSFIDRNRHWEPKMRGMIAWRFKFIMECLPLIIQVSLLLLGYALARYLWDLSHTVSSVITGFTAGGVAFYILVAAAGTFSKTCPFQTPISVAIRATWERYQEDTAEAFKATQNFFGSRTSHSRSITDHQQIATSPITSDIDDQIDEVHCISTMFKISKTPDSITATMAYVLEIVWDRRIKSTPLLQIYQTLRESLRRSADGKVSPRQEAKDLAFWSAKALLHIYIQRRCIYPADTLLLDQAKLINHRDSFGHHGSNRDYEELTSLFYIIDWTFGVQLQPRIPWSELQLSESHHCWLGHILQYRAWDSIQTQGGLSEDVRGFLDYSLACGTLPDRVVSNCLFIINMIAGYRPQPQELVIKNQSDRIDPLIDGVFDTLENSFKQNTPSGDITRAVEALERVVLLQQRRIQIRSYALFRTIMGFVKRDDRLWNSARLLIKGAYSSKEWVPPTENPKEILDFLHFHISLSQRTTFDDDSIHRAFRSLVIAPSAEKRRAVAKYGFDSTLFIDVIIQLLQNKDHVGLQRVSLLVLPELDDIFFTSEAAFNDPGRAESFVTAWSTAINEFLHEPPMVHFQVAGVNVLLAIANLPCLRIHLPTSLWDLAYKFNTVLYLDSPSMQRCIQNPDILPFIKKSPDATRPLAWLGMLWIKYHSLSAEVRGQLEAETLAISSDQRHYNLDSHVSLFDAELKRLREKIGILEPLDQSVPRFQADLDAMERAKVRLVAIRKEGLAKLREERQNSSQSHTSSSNLSFSSAAARAIHNLVCE